MRGGGCNNSSQYAISNWDKFFIFVEKVKNWKTVLTAGILEETYDDVDEVAEKVRQMNGKLDEADNTEGIFEESYDDLDTVAEQAQIHMKNGMFFYGKENFLV